MAKRIKPIEQRTTKNEVETVARPMNEVQIDILIEYLKSAIRILIYMLAVMFGGLCYAIGKLEQLRGIWLFLYPAIFLFLVYNETHIFRKKKGS